MLHNRASGLDRPASRLAPVPEVWDEGFDGPGRRGHVRTLVKSLGLDPAMSALDLGAC